MNENTCAYPVSDLQENEMVFTLGGPVCPFPERMQIRFVVHDDRYCKGIF